MGIVAEKNQAQAKLEALKPTEEEIRLTAVLVALVVADCPGLSEASMACDAIRRQLPERFAAYRVQLTERVCAGEGYESRQDLEKRQILANRVAALQKENDTLREENTQYASVFSKAVAFLQSNTAECGKPCAPSPSLDTATSPGETP